MHAANDPIVQDAANAKTAVIPITIKGHTTPATITATVDDPMNPSAKVILANGAGSLTDAVFAGILLTGATPQIGVEIVDGNATRFRRAWLVVTDADSAGNIAAFALGVVQRGNGKITAQRNVQINLTLNGSINAAIAVSGTKCDLHVEWN